MKTVIDQMGIEVEGEFSGRAAEILGRFGKMKSDGSLRKCSEEKHNQKGYIHDDLFCNEFITPPVQPDRIAFVLRVLHRLYRQKQYHFNTSAGFHIHFSFLPKRPPEIMSLEFEKYFLARIQTAYPSMFRRRSTKYYCRVPDELNDEVVSSSSRYAPVNFLPAMEKHGTIEFRIFATNSPRVMLDYFDTTHRIIEDFLDIAYREGLHREINEDLLDRGRQYQDIAEYTEISKPRSKQWLRVDTPQPIVLHPVELNIR